MFTRTLKTIPALLCAVLTAPTWAQSQRPDLQQPWQPPTLVIAAPGEAPVVLKSVKARAEINGRSALTELTLTFYNPNARQLEGELQFPLRPGQTVVGMAMGVNGAMREAVPVEKAHGEAVFEDVTRTRIDPALLSVTQGDNYKLRVYPLMPRSEKVVVLRIAEWLSASANANTNRGGRIAYRLPLDYGRQLASFNLDLHVAGAAGRPSASVRGVAMPAFAAAASGWALATALDDPKLGGALELSFAPAAAGSVSTQRVDGQNYFVAQVPLVASAAPRALPRVVSLAWDASGSGARRDHAREFALLDAYFAKARDIEVRLVRVRDTAEPVQRFVVRGGDWRPLRGALEKTIYDGATDLGAVTLDAEAGELLLFSDGLSNFGTQRFTATARPVYAVSAASQIDSARLRGIAEVSGGRFIDLTSVPAASAIDQLLQASTRVVALESADATQLVSTSIYASDGTLTVAGQLSAEKAAVRVIVEEPDGRRRTLSVAVDAERDRGTLAAQTWARLKIASLDGEYAFHRSEIRRIGLAHGIVTRDTSLIILDRAADYARHEIAPPPDLAVEVAALRASARQVQRASEASQLDAVVKLFEAKQAWWNTDFSKRKAPVALQKGEDRAGRPSGATFGNARDNLEPVVPPRAELDRAMRPAPPMAAAPVAGSADSYMRSKTLEAGKSADTAVNAAIRLRPAQSNAPYLARLRAAPAEEVYRHYLDERADYLNSTAFYLDVADLLYERGQTMLATRVLSNLAEMDLENRQLLRILGARLQQAGRADLALPIFRQVLVLAPNEPQSQRDLGLALAAAKQPQAAIEALYEVAHRQWPRFPEIELIALAEMNALIATSPTPLDTSRIDPRLLKNLPLDLRATLSWDADNTDIDLWVTDPSGERCYYGAPLSAQGGRMSHDITSGYGPEEFSLKRARPGKYIVQAQFYGHRQQIVSSATTIQLTLTTGFGTARQQDQAVTLRLTEPKAMVLVGEFEVRPGDL